MIIAGCHSRLEQQTALADAGAEIWVLPKANGKVDLRALLQRLAEEGANEVMIEAGATLTGAFAQAHLVDEYILYIAPTFLGSSAKPLLEWPLKSMRDQRRLTWVDTRSVGDDLRLIARPK